MRKILFVACILVLSVGVFAQNMETIFEDLSEKLAPCVVNIISESTVQTAQAIDPFDLFGFNPFGGNPQPKTEIRKTQGKGTGFIIDTKGYIVTNTHVVKGAEKITVVLNDGREFPGEAWIDSRTDLALVKIKADGLKAIEMGDSDKLKVGQWVMAIGNPYGFQNTITTGVISGLSREFAVGGQGDDATYYPDAIQTDASINPGNSGGPLVDLKGRVIGINSAIASPSGGSVGLGFAVPVNTAKFVIERLIKDGKVVRGYFGVVTTKLTNAQQKRLGVKEGAYVKSFSKGTPAADSGMKVEDVIVEIDGKPIKTPVDLRRVVEAIEPGKTVKTKVIRDGKEETLEVKVGELPNSDVQPTAKSDIDLGMTLTDLTGEIKAQLNIADDVEGVMVKSITRGGAAQVAGVLPKDIITKVNGTNVKSVQEFNNAVKGLDPQSSITLIVLRGEDYIALDLQ